MCLSLKKLFHSTGGSNKCKVKDTSFTKFLKLLRNIFDTEFAAKTALLETSEIFFLNPFALNLYFSTKLYSNFSTKLY